MAEDFEKKIDEIEKETIQIINDMDTLSKRFIEETKSFIQHYIRKIIEIIVKRQYDITNNLTKEQLGNLKENCKSLISIIPSKVDETFSNDTFWTHKEEIPEFPNEYKLGYDEYQDQCKKLRRTITQFEKDINVQLSKFGYKTDLIRYHDDPSLFKWSENMISIINEYSSLNKQLFNLKRELVSTQRKKGESEAQNLWDDV